MRSPTARARASMRGSSRNRTGYPCFTIAAHDPDGVTMGPSSGKERRNFRAIARASFRFPELKAGWPQHVWERGTRTVAPNRSSTCTVASQTPGEKASARQVKKRETGMGSFGSIPVVYVMRRFPRLQRFLPPFPGPDPDHFLEVEDEDLPVADLSGTSGGQDPFDHRGHHLVVHCRLDLDFGDEVDHVFRPAVNLRVAFLASKPLHLEHCHPGHAHLVERFLHLV